METYCLKLAEYLRKDRPVDVIALRGRIDGRPPSLIALLLFPFTVLRKWLALSDAPAIIHIGDLAVWPLALPGWLLAPNAKIVVSAHGTDISYALRPTVRGRLYRVYQRIGATLLSSARIIANSDATAQACRNVGWRGVSVCPLATDMELQAGAQLRTNTILFAGRLIRQKGLSWFVEEVLPLVPDQIVLEVAGPVVDADEGAALDSERVRYLGAIPQDRLARHYAEALCVVVPNIDLGDGSFEGFGLVACEAAAAGGIVFASDYGGLSSAVRDKKTGFLLPHSNSRVWAEKISEIAGWTALERADFASEASRNARKFYNWTRVSEQTQAEYASLTTERGLA
ncbi:glycosyltransferase family 4 protein [Erythrobacter sp. GH1-10]|uniref:glycosyltransferase family 4 protein n=1 Tax=Erythrobacter sp. GH1-10 TaxID=3349334 RepID=UPI003877FE46